MPSQVYLKFTTSENTSPLQLSQFLQLYVTTYRALERLSNYHLIESCSFDAPIDGLFNHLKFEDIKSCLLETSLDSDPEIISINQQSPIEIAISGSIILLTIASILSGGKQRLGIGPVKFEFSLSSLGESINKLRRGLTNNPALSIGYEFRGSKIKLSKEEFSWLNKSVNMNGGFQRFIRELQVRVKKNTREIELSNHDIEKILKYKSNPEKGGFQSRFNKIFGKHFG